MNNNVKSNNKFKLLIIVLLVFAMLACCFTFFGVTGVSAEGENNCTNAECAGTYENGICNADNTHYQAATLSNGVYEIANVGQLMWFAAKVNGGEGTINGKLTEDIDASKVALAIGNDTEHPYKGTFDGNFKSLKVEIESAAQYAAPFLFVNGGTVKNLTVHGKITTSQKFAASIIGRAEGAGATLENCLSDVVITSTVEGDGTHGGLIAVAGGGTVNVLKCGFSGAINGETTKFCGGIVGYSSTTTTIKNSYSAATFNLADESGATIVRNKATIINCYYINALNDNSTSGMTRKSADEFKSGEVAFLLNEKKNNGTWKQTLGESGDSLPNFTGSAVYAVRTTCDFKSITGYTNEVQSDVEHNYVNGICTQASGETHYQEPTKKNNVYQISNAGNLMWFAALTNGQLDGVAQDVNANAILTDDIAINQNVIVDGKLASDVSGFISWTPIGDKKLNGNEYYQGTFNGNNKRVSGLYIARNVETTGFFGAAGRNCVIKNLTIADSYVKGAGSCGLIAGALNNYVENCKATNCILSGGNDVGGIAGIVYNSVNNSKIVNCQVENCKVTSTATGNKNGRVGGIAGRLCNSDGNKISTAENCKVTNSSVTGANTYVAGIVGYLEANNNVAGCVSENCTVNGSGNYVGGIVGYAVKNNNITGCSAKNCSVTSSGIFIGGIVGCLEYNGTVEKSCATGGSVTSTGKDDNGGRVGGIAGISNDGTITYCYSTSTLSGSKRVGGIAGVAQNSSRITYCYYYGSNTATDSVSSMIAFIVNADGSNNTFIDSCYYIATEDDLKGVVNNGNRGMVTNVAAKSEEEFKNGSVAYLLNEKQNNGTYKQTLGESGDNLPNFTGSAVYVQLETCSPDSATGFTNEVQTAPKHVYNNGICTATEDETHYEPATLNNGVYEIANVGQLFWFAEKVNLSGKTSVSGKLLNDIDLENRSWTAIGTSINQYKGTFDGNGKTISNFSLTVAATYQGLFGVVTGGTVKNFTVKGKIVIASTEQSAFSCIGGAVGIAQSGAKVDGIKSYVTITDDGHAEQGNSYIGGIVGHLNGSTLNNCIYYGAVTMQRSECVAGIVGFAESSSKVTRCENYGAITSLSNSAHIGGIAGDAQTETQVTYCVNYGKVTSGGTNCIGGVVAYANRGVKIENCANIGEVECTANGHGFIGGILGYINHANFGGIANCYNYGKIVTSDGCSDLAGAIVGNRKDSGDVFTNNYYLDTSCASAYGISSRAITATAKNKKEFDIGYVSYLLGGEWGQDLTKDGYPVLGSAKPTEGFAFIGQVLNVGGDLSVKYYVAAFCADFDSEKLVMEFTFQNAKNEVKAVYDEQTKRYVFVLEGINPQFMGDNISATLKYDGIEKCAKNNYSVEQNLNNLLETYSDDKVLCELINGIFAYGEAYEELSGYESLKGSYDQAATDVAETTVTLGQSFACYTVCFGNMNYLKVKFALSEGETIYLNDVDVTDKKVADGSYYVLTTDGVSVLDFAKKYNFVIKNADESDKETLSVSVNDYLYVLASGETSSAETKTFVKALYNYGLVATHYDHKANDTGEHTATDGSHLCKYCGETLSTCQGGTATCEEQPTCSVCGKKYGTALGHDYSWSDEGEKHKGTCTHEGCDKTVSEDHVDDDNDGVCDVCQGTLPQTDGSDGNETPNENLQENGHETSDENS